MKKIVLALTAIIAMSGNVIANEYNVMSNGFSLGTHKLDMGEDADNITSYELGYYLMLGDEFRYGAELNMGTLNDDSSASSELLSDISLRFGYALSDNLDAYGTVGYGVQTFAGGITSASGLVYGLAVHYGISNNFGVVVDYKKYNLNYDFVDVDYDLSSIGLKLNISF